MLFAPRARILLHFSHTPCCSGTKPAIYLIWNVTLREVQHLPTCPALRAALFAGYRTTRPFPSTHERYLHTFFALRRI
jgi:Ser/Thr protein kinase RdoA (MazF antagonist)